MTDLDGTAVHEWEGRIVIPEKVALALKRLNDQGRPAIINSLRFPLNVIRTFGREWYAITNAPLPMVSLNGSQVGYLIEAPDGHIGFRELEAFPVSDDQVGKVLDAVAELLSDDLPDFILFYYPRDWLKGEIIWTPLRERVEPLKAKFGSAGQVVTSSLDQLHAALTSEPICMMLLLIDAPQDRLMAYQHANRSQFITRAGVDKSFGADVISRTLGVELGASVGAGDTVMDTFLTKVGLAIHVGATGLDYRGTTATARVNDSIEFGELLFQLAELQQQT
jgi:hydroxymethylpyrimidine pyrophosphatase-like HAD family hydrolase